MYCVFIIIQLYIFFATVNATRDVHPYALVPAKSGPHYLVLGMAVWWLIKFIQHYDPIIRHAKNSVLLVCDWSPLTRNNNVLTATLFYPLNGVISRHSSSSSALRLCRQWEHQSSSANSNSFNTCVLVLFYPPRTTHSCPTLALTVLYHYPLCTDSIHRVMVRKPNNHNIDVISWLALRLCLHLISILRSYCTVKVELKFKNNRLVTLHSCDVSAKQRGLFVNVNLWQLFVDNWMASLSHNLNDLERWAIRRVQWPLGEKITSQRSDQCWNDGPLK